jgi:hypothetical protein
VPFWELQQANWEGRGVWLSWRSSEILKIVITWFISRENDKSEIDMQRHKGGRFL